MANPLRTEHSLDWSKTAQELEDEYQAGMIERDRYRDALDRIAMYPCDHWDEHVECPRCIAGAALGNARKII